MRAQVLLDQQDYCMGGDVMSELLADLAQLSLLARGVMLLCVWVIGMMIGACLSGWRR